MPLYYALGLSSDLTYDTLIWDLVVPFLIRPISY